MSDQGQDQDRELQSDLVARNELFWTQLWDAGSSPWHVKGTNPTLEKFYGKLIPADAGKVDVFLPFCGASVDLKWLYDEGHRVFGIELSETAIRDFFGKQGLQFTVQTDVAGYQLLQTDDQRLRIVQGNFFKLTDDRHDLKSSTTCVWDRGAFVAINSDQHPIYLKNMRHLLRENFRYLLQVVEYDESTFTGPPFNVPEARIHEMFGTFCDIEKVDTVRNVRPVFGTSLDITTVTYFMTPKK